MAIDRLKAEVYADIEQAASLIARDVIAPVARESVEPVAFLTGNRYVPAIRSLAEVERVWQIDSAGSGNFFWRLVEAIEERVDGLNIHLAAPEDDNSLYVVDLDRWEYIEDSDDAENYNDQWRGITR